MEINQTEFIVSLSEYKKYPGIGILLLYLVGYGYSRVDVAAGTSA